MQPGAHRWDVRPQTHEVDVYGKGVTAALSANTAAEIDRTSSKRRRVDPEESEEHVPIHLRRVTTFHDLVRLVRAYYGGKGSIKSILPVGIDHQGVDEWDDETASTNTPRFTDYIDAYRQFSRDEHLERAIANDMLDSQREITSYVTKNAAGDRFFYPTERLRKSGLVRHFKCGPGGFIQKEAKELMKYTLPSFNVTLEEARKKITRTNNAVGIHRDLSDKTLEELIGSDGGEGCYNDPHDYAPIEIEDSELVDGDIGESSFRRIIRANYHITTTIEHINVKSFSHHSAKGDCVGMRRFMARAVHDLGLLLSGKTADGIPKVYGKLYKESARLLAELNNPASSDRHVKKARRMFYARSKHDFTGLSWMFIRDVTGAQGCLKFMIQQQTVYMLLYNMHFSVTSNRSDVSSVVILAGPNDTGKTHAMKAATQGMADSLTRTEDSSSSQANMVDDSSDLMMVIQDEYKGANGDGTDASSSDRTKTEQSRISNGVTVRRRWHRNAKTDKVEIEVAIGIERTGFVCGTNAVQRIPSAIISRASVVPVVLANSRAHRDRIVDNMANGVAAAIHNDPKVQLDLKAWQLSSKVMSSLQVHYTALEAVGAIPPMLEDCFQVFKLLHIERFHRDRVKKDDKTHSSRGTNDLLRMATAIHIRDHLSIWYQRGLGEHFGYDKSVEALW